MSERHKQHMGRNEDDESQVLGRDIREGDEDAERAERGIPLPSEEGRTRGFQENERTDAPPDAGTGGGGRSAT